MRLLDFSIGLILPAANRNEYQESSWGVKGGRCVRLTTSPPTVSQLSRKCGILDVSNLMGLHGLLQGQLYLLSQNITTTVMRTSNPTSVKLCSSLGLKKMAYNIVCIFHYVQHYIRVFGEYATL
jgi:hypothetical protein